MTSATHPVAPHHLPSFITAPGETDVLMVTMAVILLASVLGFGILFLTLHTLPERIAHKSHKLQFEIVAVLGLLALFTHQHIFWVAGLLLALIELPDVGSWLARIAGSVERIADNQSNVATKPPPEVTDAERGDAATAPQGVVGGRRDGHVESMIPKLVPTNTGS
jgi:hypothetical protein